MDYISAAGFFITLVADKTFPAGIILRKFADDSDPFDFPDITVAEYGIGLNGDMVVWQKAVPLPIDLNVLPNTDEEKNLSVLLEANRQKKGKNSAKDVITITANYPDGTVKTLQSGAILVGSPMQSIASNGRMKTKHYGFVFENVA